MNCSRPVARGSVSAGFTRTDLIAILGSIALVALLAVPLIARTTTAAVSSPCLDNARQLTLAWSLFASDHGGELPNNFAINETLATVAAKTYRTWAHNILDWTTNPSNTNLVLVTNSTIFPYTQKNPTVFACPADRSLSAAQKAKGWIQRVRSYSMNAFMGAFSASPSDPTYQGRNPFYVGYRQFMLSTSIPYPADTLVFLEEHPDSVNDGNYLNNPAPNSQWGDLPASYHNGSCVVSFADAHVEMHEWLYARTKQPVRFTSPQINAIPPSERGDYDWLAQRTSVNPTTLGIAGPATNQLQIIWSALPTNYVLQTAVSLSDGVWTNVPTVGLTNRGQKAVIQSITGQQGFFRLLRQ